MNKYQLIGLIIQVGVFIRMGAMIFKIDRAHRETLKKLHWEQLRNSEQKFEIIRLKRKEEKRCTK